MFWKVEFFFLNFRVFVTFCTFFVLICTLFPRPEGRVPRRLLTE